MSPDLTNLISHLPPTKISNRAFVFLENYMKRKSIAKVFRSTYSLAGTGLENGESKQSEKE